MLGVVIGVPVGRVSVKVPAAIAPLCRLSRISERGPGKPWKAPVPPEVCQTLGVPPKALSGVLGESSIQLYAVQLAALDSTLRSQQTDLNTLRSQIHELRRQAKLLSDWHDTVNSPWYRRLVWWFMGFRLSALGTWYDAPWNRWAGSKYNYLRTHRQD